MELSTREEKVLAVLALRGDASLKEISAEVSLPVHLVRGAIERLRRRELIVPRLYLDLYRVGLREFSFYFSLAGTPKERAAALDALLSRPGISWAVELVGEFGFGCSGFFRSIEEFHRLLQEVVDAHPGVIQSGTFGVVLSLTDYGFAGGRQKLRSVFRYGGAEYESAVAAVHLDAADWRILRALSENPGESLARAARHLKLPLSTVTHRVQQMRTRGVIQGTQFLFNFPASQFRAYRILATCMGATSKERESLRERCLAHPLVYFMVELAGEWEFEIGVFARDAGELNQLSLEIQTIFTNTRARLRVLTDARLLKLSPCPFSYASDSVESPDARRQVVPFPRTNTP